MQFLTQLLPSLADFGVWGYWFILLTSLVEALVIVGSFVPGALFVIFAGILVSKGVYNLGYMIIFASVGAILGDLVSYYLGSKGTHLFKNENRLLKADHLTSGKAFFEKYGDKSVLIGRFLGPVRSIVPFVAGLTGMNKRSFLLWNVAGGIVWSVSHLYVGYFFGGSLGLIHQWSTLVTIFILGLISILAMVWVGVKQSEFLLRFWHPLALFFSGFLVYQIADTVFLGESVPFIDMRIYNLLLLVRDDELILFFKFVTIIGNWQFIIPTALLLSILLFYKKQLQRYIPQLWVTLISAEAITYALKVFVARPRPLNGLLVENDFSFPSGHATIAMAFFGTLIYIAWSHIHPSRYRQFFIFIGVSLILLIGFSRLYLGVHYFSDILTGYLVGFIGILLGRSVFAGSISQLKEKSPELRSRNDHRTRVN
jgi:undecaprenyl-diphosphatase